MRHIHFENKIENNGYNAEISVNYCKSLLQYGPLSQNCIQLDNVTLIGTATKNIEVTNLMRTFTENNDIEATVFNKCVYKSLFLHSSRCTRISKTDDSVIKLKNGKVIQIHHFVQAERKCYLCGCEWVTCDNDFNEDNEAPIVEHILKIVERKSDLIIHDIDTFDFKLMVLNTGEQLIVQTVSKVIEVNGVTILNNTYQIHFIYRCNI